MDAKKVWAVAIFALLFGAMVLAWPFTLPPGNHSQHNDQAAEQRNQSTGGAGIPGGKDQYWPINFPSPLPHGRH